MEKSRPDSDRESATDSPWFWLIVFLCGGLVALVLTGPKYSWRQPQIERQYQAREISGQSVSPAERPEQLSQPGNPMLTLQPLLNLFSVAVVLSCIVFWWRRSRRSARS